MNQSILHAPQFSQLPQPPQPPQSGANMDTAITPRRWPKPKLLIVVAACVAALAGGAMWAAPRLSAQSQTVPADRLTISVVSSGTFDDFIPLRGTVAPLNTVFLDAVEGGRVERKLVEDGALLKVGQPIAVLTNSSLQLLRHKRHQ